MIKHPHFQKLKIAALIPAYNEQNRINNIIKKTKQYVDIIIVCDDGSNDLTGEIAKKLGAKVITHNKNMGYGAAIKSLIKEAINNNIDIAITIDADGQHNPDDIEKLLLCFKENDCDIVIGSRFLEGSKHNTPKWREHGISLINNLVASDGKKISDTQSGFRAYTRKVFDQIKLTENGMGISTEILIKAKQANLKICEAPITISYYNYFSNNPFIHGYSVILSTFKYLSIYRPLKFFGLPGLISLFISMLFWVWTFTRAQRQGVITNLAVISIGTSIIGLIFMTTGIILWVITSIIHEKLNK